MDFGWFYVEALFMKKEQKFPNVILLFYKKKFRYVVGYSLQNSHCFHFYIQKKTLVSLESLKELRFKSLRVY